MIECFDRFVLRTPRFPLNLFDEINSADNERFKEICRNDIFMEAVYLASPELFEEMRRWINEEDLDKVKIKKLKNTLLKYFSRCTSRCTPFGLFAGISVGKISDKNDVLFSSNYEARVTRLDMNFLCSFIQYLVRIPDIQNNVKFYPNSSLYRIDNKWRYIEYYFTKNTTRYHKVSSIKNNEFLEKIVAGSRNGLKKSEYIQSLISNGISSESANEYITKLIENQLLVSELDPIITKPNILQHIIDIIKKIDGQKDLHDDLIEISVLLIKIDKNKGDNLNYYSIIKKKLAKYKVEFNKKYLFQTDLITPIKQVTIDNDIAKEVIEAINFLTKLIPPSTRDSDIVNFKNEFFKRYEENDIPLQIALDPEVGIGYPVNKHKNNDLAPLIDDLIFPVTESTSGYLKWNHLQQLLLNKISESNKNQRLVIELTQNDISELPSEQKEFPTTFSALIELLSKPGKGNPYIVLNSVGNISAIPLIGRFCHLSDELKVLANEIAKKDMKNSNGSLLAEIIHLPQSRTGNILLHPPFYEYEIPYLAASNETSTTRIDLSDLFICVRNNKIKLISKSLRKEIIPRLSNAHNFATSNQPLYRFLCDLQYQNKFAGFSFTWGSVMGKFNFYPRVVYKNVILSKALWIISKEEAKTVFGSRNDDTIQNRVDGWKKNRKLPDKIVLVEGDNELLLDLRVLSNIELLIQNQKKGKGFILKEFLHNTENGIIEDSLQKIYSNQIVLPLFKNSL